MAGIQDFTEQELKIVQDSLNERYGENVEIQLADAEIRRDPSARELTVVPAIFWMQRGTNFVIFKVGNSHYRSQFYYRGYQQYGTGHQMFDDIGNCVITTLQVQVDHESKPE